MNEWIDYKLGDISDWYSGGTPSKDKKEFWGGSIPWISAKTMTNYKVNSSELNITNEGLLNGSRLAVENDILLLVRGSGLFNDIPINMVEKPVAFNQDIKAIRAKDPELQDFIFFWLHGNKKGLNDILEETGIGAGKFDTDLLKKLDITIPTDKDEFNFIIQTAQSIFDKIDLLHRQNATLEKMVETLFRQWFVEEAIVQSEKQILLGDLIESVSITHKFPNNHVVFLNTSDIYLGNVLVHDPIEVKTLPGQAKKTIKKDDILFSEIRPANGRWAYIDFDAENYVVSTKLMVLRSKRKISQAFIYFYLTNAEIVNWLQMLAESRSGTFPQITFDQIKDLIINIPSKEILDFATSWCELTLNKIKSNQTQIRTLTALRDTLLPKLMSGEVRVEI